MNEASFTVAYWCVLMAALLPILCAGVAKYGMFSKPSREGGYDNGDPRSWLSRQKDWRSRANAAQQNSFEALPFFIGAVIIAHTLGAYQVKLDLLAFFWVMLRLVYIMMYVADLPTARSIVWALALLLNVWILFTGFR
ncbi:MAG: MAPEG family protein [Bdellovibrionales bacterium]|nr:MAPEG family protein [Ramlibacter sp.]